MNNKRKKLLIWTLTDIRQPSGTPAILITLINLLPNWSIVYCCGKRSKAKQEIGRSIRIRYYSFIEKADFLNFFNSWIVGLAIDLFFKVPLLLLICIYTVLSEKPDRILTIFFNRSWVLSLYLTAKLLRKNILVYSHDPFKEKYALRSLMEYRLMSFMERKVLEDKTTTTLLVLNQGLENLYKNHTTPMLLPNISRGDINPFLKSFLPHTMFRIAFSGSIYENNRELIYSLVEVVKQNTDCELHFFGNYGKTDLVHLQSINSVKVHFINDQRLLLNELMNYDLLYLPLSFVPHKGLPLECLRPVFPTKALDYISTNRPILLHCPEDFFIASFFRLHGIEFCLHSAEMGELDKAIKQQILSRRKESLQRIDYEKLMYKFSVEGNQSKLNYLFNA